MHHDSNPVCAAVILQTVGCVLLDDPFKVAAVLFPHRHFAVFDLDAGLQLEEVCSQCCDRAAPTTLFHIVQAVKDEAGIRILCSLVEFLANLLRLHLLHLCQLCRQQHQ